MLFNSIEYLFLYIPIVFTIYFLINKFKFFRLATLFLLLSSLYFYGTYKIEYVYIIIISILFNYIVSCIFRFNINNIYKKLTLFMGIWGNISLLIYFKYFDFLIETFSKINIIPFNTMEIIMPLGISFFTLQQISYIIDCFKKEIKEYNLLDYALFVCFFPQLVAGPIIRYKEMIPQFRDIKNRIPNQENIFIGLFLITVGLLKKVIFADSFADFIDDIMQYNLYKEILAAWFLGFSKLLQGYFDFSGYCDIALGSAFLFNISLPINFNSPFKADSITEYWRRWNMTIIRFIKDYIYEPMGSNKKGFIRTGINTFMIFFVYGCWMGSNIFNILYGILNGILVCINKLWTKLNIPLPKFICIFTTFIFLILLTPFISFNDNQETIEIIKSMFGVYGIKNLTINGIFIEFYPIYSNLKFNILIFLLSLYIIFMSKNSNELAKLYVKANNSFLTFILAIIFVITSLSITKSTEFIYFAF